MAKEVLGLIKLQIPAGGANPSPPVGPALGQRGLNIMDFCKAFNDKTKDIEKGAPIPVIITAYKDRSFDFVTKLPPVSYYLKKEAWFNQAFFFLFYGAPGESRTPDILFRRQALYPAELRVRSVISLLLLVLCLPMGMKSFLLILYLS